MTLGVNCEIYDVLAGAGRVRRFAAGDVLIAQDERGAHIFYIKSGQATAMAYGINGERTWLGRFGAGDFVGDMSMLSDLPVPYEVCADTDLDVLAVPFAAMEQLMDAQAGLSKAVAGGLAARLHTAMQRLSEAFTLSATGRVCAELSRLSVPVGSDPDRHIIRPGPVFTELALRVSSTRETVSRTVSRLQKSGVVSRAPGALIIESPERLSDEINR